MLIGAGAAVGIAAGLQVSAMIDRAGTGGLFGGPVALPVEARRVKPSAEDRAMGAALAAAVGADEAADCRTFDPRHRAGCADYVADRSRDRSEAPPAAADPRAERAAATDWPAAFD